MTPTRSEIELAVIEILAGQLLRPAAEIAPDASIEALGLDSLGKVEAIFALEERFGIAIPFNANDDRAESFPFDTIPRIVDGVAQLVAPPG